MNYSICKVIEPTKTIEKIKKLLNEVGITLQEKIPDYEKNENSNLHSLTVYLSGCPKYKAEGKGTSLINARASGYAEYIERVQNGFIFPISVNDFVYTPDEKFVDKNLFLNIKAINKTNFFALNDVANAIRKNIPLKDIHKVLTIPFYGIKEKKVVQIPILVYDWLIGSNGMASGNSIEEALVQSLSEICERFVLKQVIENQLAMPDIPEYEYLKYSKISAILSQYKKSGYTVQIKDASLGLQLPVVCTIIYNSNQNTYTYTFGAHPTLPVAIERCLTEYAQGLDISNKKNYQTTILQDNNYKDIVNKNSADKDFIYNTQYIEKEIYKYLADTGNLNFLFEKQFLHRVDIENCEYIQKQIFKKEQSYSYCASNWLDNKNIDNKFLLNFILKKIKNYTSEIYVRDVSFLGFSSVRVIIPKMSFIYKYNKDRIIALEKWIKWLRSDYKSEKESIYELYKALDIKLNSKFHFDSQFSDLPIEYILFVCAIYLNDIDKVLLLANTIIKNNKKYKIFKDEFITRIDIIKKYYELKLKNITFSEILKEISFLYESKDIEKFKIFMRYLSAEVIKILINRCEFKRGNNIRYNSQKRIVSIIDKLVKKYKHNIINQASLMNIFNDI